MEVDAVEEEVGRAARCARKEARNGLRRRARIQGAPSDATRRPRRRRGGRGGGDGDWRRRRRRRPLLRCLQRRRRSGGVMSCRWHAALWHSHEGSEPLPRGTGGHRRAPERPVVASACALGLGAAAAGRRHPSVGAVCSRGSPAGRAVRARLWRRRRAKDTLEAVSLPQRRVRREGSPPAAHHAVLRDVVDELGREEVRAALVERSEAALYFRDVQKPALRHRHGDNHSSNVHRRGVVDSPATPQVQVTELAVSVPGKPRAMLT